MKIYNDKEITNNTNYPDLFKLFKVIATTYIKLYVFNDKLWMLYYLNKQPFFLYICYYWYSGTSRYEINSFQSGFRIMIFSYNESRFTCKSPNSFQALQKHHIKFYNKGKTRMK